MPPITGPLRLMAYRDPGGVRLDWQLGGRIAATLQTSTDLAEYIDEATILDDGTDVRPLSGPRRFWRLKYPPNVSIP